MLDGVKAAASTPGPARVRRGALVLLGLSAALLPVRTFRSPFLLDDTQVLENPDLRDLSRLPGLFARGYWEGIQGDTKGDQYRPVTMATLNLSLALSGDERPEDFRAVNFALHGLASALLAALVARTTGSRGAGLLAGALHACLPVHADTVVGIIHRGELLAAVFALGAALLHANARDRGRAPFGAAALYALAVLSKESAAALPLALLLLDRLALPSGVRRPPREWVRLYGPHAAALLACLAARVAVLGRIGLEPDTRYFAEESGLVAALTMAKFATLHYARPLLLGTPLIADFSRQSFPSAHPRDPVAWACLAGWAAFATGAFFLAWRRRSVPAAGMAVALSLALPVSNLLVRTGILGAHRALYLPAAGWCLALGAGSAHAIAGKRRAVFLAGASTLLGLYAVLFVRRGEVWRDRETFYSAALARVPDNVLFVYNLGETRTEQGRFAEAEGCYRRVLALDPRFFAAGNNLVGVLLEQGRSEEALAWSESLEARTDRQRAAKHNARAVVLGRRGGPGDYEEALAQSRRAAALAPDDPSYRVTSAQALLALRRREEAVAELRQALRLPAPSRSAELARAQIFRMLASLKGPSMDAAPFRVRPGRP
ncbi:MAG TPA: tetratricopeptide repeat protein [Planctomycetota bacterium]|jgi:tetratricopeptide (TPR) repeat protein|nr:tetratricopeptide repeat protein [Planctomycetota bacterium]